MINKEALNKVDEHWAVLAVGAHKRDRALEVANAKLVKSAVGQQLKLDFNFKSTDDETITALADAYEMAAIEGLHAFVNMTSGENMLREQCVAGAWRTFELRRLFDLPNNLEERISHVLHVSALAYCGDRWSDLRRWFNENADELKSPSVAGVTWDKRLLYRLYDCWLRLFRKNGWDDLDRIREIIAGLREDQKVHEKVTLDKNQDAETRAMAMRLVALYHWAKATELLAIYMLQGNPTEINALLEKHFEQGIEAASVAYDSELEVLLRWLFAASRQMVSGSLWWATRTVNSRVTKFVSSSTKRGLFELLPPQRAALLEEGLLDTSKTAVVIEMPTSGGKTLLAQFRMLQALNQFNADNGWVAYVAPTRALTAQISRRLRRDFSPIGIKVEQLTGAVEIDTFEEDILSDKGGQKSFDILVATPEKLQLIIRNKKVNRPLALIVLDEAHNIEDESRGLRIELLLATIKRECRLANFLLLMPYVPNAEALARWLADDLNAGHAISVSTTPWQPNERIVGMFRAEADDSVQAGWHLKFQTLITTPKTIHLKGDHSVGNVKPLDIPKSKVIGNDRQKGLGLQAVAMARVLSERGTSIAVGRTIPNVWLMAKELTKSLPQQPIVPNEIRLVQNFLKTEISENFELIDMLSRGIGVHHAGLSDEVRSLIEWLAEESKLRVLCATSTIAQGINFPVSSVFLASRHVPKMQQSVEMSSRDFWNLAGRAGRMGHDSVGVIGLAQGEDSRGIQQFVSMQTGDLVSRLISLVDKLGMNVDDNLQVVIHSEQWEDFRCYVAHLLNEKKNIDVVLAETEQLLRNTFGYNTMRNERSDRAGKLLKTTRKYAESLSNQFGSVAMADATGFSPEGVKKALVGISGLENKLTYNDWMPERLFGKGRNLADLFGVMMKIPQLQQLNDLAGSGKNHKNIADVTNAWVSGKSIHEIAQLYFNKKDGNNTDAITDACRAIYRNLVNTGTWGISALSHMSGIEFEKLSEKEKRKINMLPAMIYHGVQTEEAVLMRMNFVPRSISEPLGKSYAKQVGNDNISISEAREYLRSLSDKDWDHTKSKQAQMTGEEYRQIWELLSGENR